MSKDVTKATEKSRKAETSTREAVTAIPGSIGLQDSIEQDPEKIRYDRRGKKVLQHKEVLANILKYGVPQYESYSMEEIIQCIDMDSIVDDEPIAPDTDTRIHGDNTEESSVNSASLTFDSRFRVRLPSDTQLYLHVDVELQGNYYPGYSLEKRGIYHLARMISSQLEVINKKTNYGKLKKACAIFICVGNVPKFLWNTVSYYQFSNTKNIGDISPDQEDYDLMDLIMIRIGPRITNDTVDIVKFLHGLFFYSMEELKPYIDFSKNDTFRKEVENLGLTGEHLIERAQLQFDEELRERENKLKNTLNELQEKDESLQAATNELQEKDAQIADLMKKLAALETDK